MLMFEGGEKDLAKISNLVRCALTSCLEVASVTEDVINGEKLCDFNIN